MTSDEIKSAITGWCNQETALQLVEDRSEPGADFALALRSSAFGGGVPIDVVLDQGSDRVTVRSTTASPAGESEIRDLIAQRPAYVRGEVSGGTAVITSHAYTDGFSKNVFLRTVDEVAKTRALLDGLAGATAATPVSATSSASSPEPWSPSTLPAETVQPAGSPLPAPSFGSPAQATYSPPSGQPAPQAQPAPVFAPTHTVPPQGMQAWGTPDPSSPVVATLGGGLPIQVSEVRGAWAHVVCSNGWTGWVDGRIIGVAR
jgi:hypothetical protein